jgi:membrane associated rhomboid family serine protease
LDPRAISVSWERQLYGLMAGAILGVILRHQLIKPFVNKIEEEEENEGEVK